MNRKKELRTVRKALKLSKEEYYEKHLHIINHILPIQLTKTQVKVLAAFLSLEGDLEKDPFSTTGRKIVMERLNLKPGGLGNYLEVFRENNYIIKKDGKEQILPILIPDKKEQLYLFKLEKDE